LRKKIAKYEQLIKRF